MVAAGVAVDATVGVAATMISMVVVTEVEVAFAFLLSSPDDNSLVESSTVASELTSAGR